MPSERRRFSRIQFHTKASLQFSSGEFDVELVDISLKGALVRPRDEMAAEVGQQGSLVVVLDATDYAIRMEITVIHRDGDSFGLGCREIDLDSITHLRRLVELNLGDESILNRELSVLARLED